MKDEITILIVDDIPANVDLLRKTLEVEGYSISMVSSGEVAISLSLGKLCVTAHRRLLAFVGEKTTMLPQFTFLPTRRVAFAT